MPPTNLALTFREFVFVNRHLANVIDRQPGARIREILALQKRKITEEVLRGSLHCSRSNWFYADYGKKKECMETYKGEIGLAIRGEERSQWQQFCFGVNPVRTFKRVIIWSICAIFLFNNLLVPIQIIGSSMAPTYRDGSYNFVNKLAYSRTPPQRGDVIALEAEGELLLKRIVGVPGEKVSIHNGELRVNGKDLKDSFAMLRIPWEMSAASLGPDEYFVIGDNRSTSVFCKIHKNQILGKIIF
jgi:signal peptidase I